MSYVIDLNQGSYQSGIVTLDATNQLTGSQGYASLKDAYITVPFVTTLRNTGAAALPSVVNAQVAALKCNTATIIDKVQIEINGKTIVTPSGYLSHWNNLRAMTEWSQDDVHKYGATAMMYPDDIWSIGHGNGVVGAVRNGDGYYNNSTDKGALIDVSGNISSVELNLNEGHVKRLLANPPHVVTSGASTNALGWVSMNEGAAREICRQTGKGMTSCSNGAVTTDLASYYYLLRIRLVDIHPIFKELDLCANPQMKLTLYINTGVATIDVAGTNAMTLDSVVLNQGNTCPVMVTGGNTNSGLAPHLNGTATKLQLAWGVLGNSLTPTANAGQAFPYTTSRMYIPFYDLQPERAMEIVKQPVKKSRFLDYYVQSFKGQAGEGVQPNQHNASFSLQMSASIKNAKYVALLPFANTKSGNFARAHGTDQYASPFDSAPWTCQPGSAITNFNVQVGNKWIFNAGQNYDFEGFLNEFSKISALNGGLTHELSNGLIDEDKWSLGQRILVADVSRATEKDVPQSLLITGSNASTQGSDFICIIAYEREISLNRVTGEVESFI